MMRTSLHRRHIELGAKMVSFAGFEMPLRYSSIIKEHLNVREKVGIFDLSHMGEFEIRGNSAEAFLQTVTVNDVSHLDIGQAQYTAMCREDGGILDDCVLYRMKDHFLLVVNAANINKDWQWLQDHRFGDVELTNASNETSLIAVQGPLSRRVLQNLMDDTELSLETLSFYHHVNATIGGINVLCARTGYTGELGYELYVKGDSATRIWDVVMNTGEEFGILPIGLGARDTLRMEMKYCLYGNDIDETTNPIEAGLGWITKLDKGNFIGKEAIVAVKEKGPSRQLVTFEMVDRGIPRHGYRLLMDGDEVGVVTSGGLSPSLKKGVGLSYVERDCAKIGTDIHVEIRTSYLNAQIVKPPFWKNGSLLE